MLMLPSLSWFNFNELGASAKDLKVFCNRILGVMTISSLFSEFDSLLFSEFDSLTLSPNCLELSLIVSNFSLIGDNDS